MGNIAGIGSAIFTQAGRGLSGKPGRQDKRQRGTHAFRQDHPFHHSNSPQTGGFI
jgi:hypothetical protein